MVNKLTLPQYYSNISSLPLVARGKVRDIYEVDKDHLLIVTTDRLSAFDVVFPDPVPYKGQTLNQISNFWFDMFTDIVPNHLTTIDPHTVVFRDEFQEVENRSVVTKKLTPLPIEAVVRGYLVGSGWKEYKVHGTIGGTPLVPGLVQASELPEPFFSPSTKAAVGSHDENITFDQAVKLCPPGVAEQVRDLSIKLYTMARDFAWSRDIIIADTKFEFGLDENGTVHLIDEVLTPDSSRFWKKSDYKVGCLPMSYDKQHIREYVESIGWNKEPPAPVLSTKLLVFTTYQYVKICELLTHQWLIVD